MGLKFNRKSILLGMRILVSNAVYLYMRYSLELISIKIFAGCHIMCISHIIRDQNFKFTTVAF